MAVDELLADAVGHIVHGEAALLPLHLGVHEDLEQQIAQLLLQVLGAALVDGFGHLIALLQQIPSGGGVGLLGVPGATSGGTEDGHDVLQVFEAVRFFPDKIYHILPLTARVFPEKTGKLLAFLLKSGNLWKKWVKPGVFSNRH